MAKPNVSAEALETLKQTDSECFGLDSELKRATTYTLIALAIWIGLIVAAGAGAACS